METAGSNGAMFCAALFKLGVGVTAHGQGNRRDNSAPAALPG